MRLRSISPVTVDQEGFAHTVALVECSAEERWQLECLLDEYHPIVDVFSLCDQSPNLVELGVQLESTRRHDVQRLLQRRLRKLAAARHESTPREISQRAPTSRADWRP